MNGGRLLIVEDEPAFLRGLKDTFVSAGFDVLTATDGHAGLDLALTSHPDLILLDIMAPRVNGARSAASCGSAVSTCRS